MHMQTYEETLSCSTQLVITKIKFVCTEKNCTRHILVARKIAPELAPVFGQHVVELLLLTR